MFIFGCVILALYSIFVSDIDPGIYYHEWIVGFCGFHLFLITNILLLDWSSSLQMLLWLDLGVLLLHLPFLVFIIVHIWPKWTTRLSNRKRETKNASVWFRVSYGRTFLFDNNGGTTPRVEGGGDKEI